MQAIGMIETLGFLTAVEAADAMLKAANVSLYHQQKTGGGLMTILIMGDVGAVRAAVDAGRESAEKIGTVYSAHVIARPHIELDAMLNDSNKTVDAILQTTPASEPASASADPDTSSPAAESGTADATLEKMKVVELRTYLRKLPGNPLRPDEVRFANREMLLKAIEQAQAAQPQEWPDSE